MEMTKFDFGVIMSMSIAVIAMNFAFPLLGLAGDSPDENNIPEFNISSDRFDMAGEFPQRPGTPTKGLIKWDEEKTGDSDNQIWLDGDTSGGTEMVLLNDGNETDPRPEIVVNNWESGSSTGTDKYYIENESEYVVHNNFSYEVHFTWVETRNLNKSNMQFDVEYEIREQPSDTGWVDRIPIVGSLYSGAEATASVLSWLGSILWWFFISFWEIVLNLLGILFDIIVFAISTMQWLISTYTNIVSAANSFAAVVVSIPGILLFLEFIKVVSIGISLLPTT